MGTYAKRFAAIVPSDHSRAEEPLGDAIAGIFSDVSIDSVDAVRELRERE